MVDDAVVNAGVIVVDKTTGDRLLSEPSVAAAVSRSPGMSLRPVGTDVTIVAVAGAVDSIVLVLLLAVGIPIDGDTDGRKVELELLLLALALFLSRDTDDDDGNDEDDCCSFSFVPS